MKLDLLTIDNIEMKSLFLFLSFVFFSSTSFSMKPSFECERAQTRVEKLICSNEELAVKDMLISDYYKTLKLKSREHTLIKTQKTWIKEVRDKKCITRPKYIEIDLGSCLRRRIVEFTNEIQLPTNKIGKYKAYLKKRIKKTQRKEPKNIAERYVYEKDLEYSLNHLLGDCNLHSIQLSQWDGKRLKVTIHQSSVECTGRSTHGKLEESFCLQDNKLVQTKSFFDCKDKDSSSIFDTLFNYYINGKGFEIVSGSPSKGKFLYTLMNQVRYVKNSYFQIDNLLKNEVMIEARKLIPSVRKKLMALDSATLPILRDLLIVLDGIRKTNNWREILKKYTPHKSYGYGDTTYNFISSSFKRLLVDSEHNFDGLYIHYDYHELYHRFWYKCFLNNSIDEVEKTIKAYLKASKKN